MAIGTSKEELDQATHREIAAMLARTDFRYTRSRRRLVEVLAACDRPLSLPDLLAADGDLNQSSAYRNLDVLERAGIIRRLATGGEFAYFELAEPLLGHHHHLICLICGGIQDIQVDDATENAIDAALSQAANNAGFEPLHHSLDLHGHCAICT